MAGSLQPCLSVKKTLHGCRESFELSHQSNSTIGAASAMISIKNRFGNDLFYSQPAEFGFFFW